jgi:hypothetical protein
MAGVSELHVKVIPDLDPEFRALLGTATQDTLDKVNAGAALTYALYHTPKDQAVALFEMLPRSVVTAYMDACEAYGIGSNKAGDRYKWVEVAGETDAVRVIDANADPS